MLPLSSSGLKMEAVRACEFSIILLIVIITLIILFDFSLQNRTTMCHFYNRSISAMYWEFLPSKEMRNLKCILMGCCPIS
jgi:hypothetical protein